MSKSIEGWVVRSVSLTDALLKKHKLRKTSDKGIFVYLTGTRLNFTKFEKANPNFIVSYEKST